MRKARIASLTLRSYETSLVSRKFLATCWVIVEAPILVLGGDEGPDDQARHRADRHENAPLERVFGEQPAVARLNARHGRRLVVGELLIIGQADAVFPQHGEQAAATQYREEHERQRAADDPLEYHSPSFIRTAG
jgi:hypothetical protein